VQGMMPEKDWEQINDDWAQHDFRAGASGGDTYPKTLADRYGKLANMADFVRKSALANYEAYRAMYEGRNAKMFNPSTAVITWMSNPAQPSFVWQLYHHDLEANSAEFAVMKAGEQVHIQLNESNGSLQVINNRPEILRGATAHLAVYSLDGALQHERDFEVTGPASSAIDLGQIDPVDGHCEEWEKPCTALMSHPRFLRMILKDAAGKQLSENFYWRGLPTDPDNLQAMDTMKTVTLQAKATRQDVGGIVRVTVELHNPGPGIAIMAHLQLRRGKTSAAKGVDAVTSRVLPVYSSDNYISLVPNATRTITLEADRAELKGESPLVVIDGWNIGVSAAGSSVPVELNRNAQVSEWPATGLPIVAHTWK
jgi:hypothetical protein